VTNYFDQPPALDRQLKKTKEEEPDPSKTACAPVLNAKVSRLQVQGRKEREGQMERGANRTKSLTIYW